MKAKDLRGKNIEELDDQNPEEEQGDQDQVAAAYENISKRLESIRGGKDSEDEDESDEKEVEDKDEPELTEWKGPKPPAKEDLRPQEDEEEEEDHELRKVKLHNLEDSDEEQEEVEETKEFSRKDEDDEEEEDEKEMKASKKEWEPKEDDPLDDEDESEEEEPAAKKFSKDDGVEEETAFETSKEDDLEERDEKKFVASEEESDSLESGMPEKEVKFERPEPSEELGQPDTLDDLTENQMPNRRSESLEDEDYDIPSLKGSGQRGGNLSYNTHPEREGIGQSYSPKGNYMEGNDPNNYFSSHQQPQPPKRANKFHLLVLVLIGIVVIGFTVYVLKGGFGDLNLGTTEPSPSPSAAATPEPTPTPTPAPEVERADFTVRVLNGTTTSGLAGKVRDKLKELGYKTSTPGNNSDTDIAQTEIRVKEGTESAALLQRLIADLAPDYEAKEGKVLDSKSTNDAEVIIGAK